MLQASDIAAIRAEFPILQQQVNGKDLVYFDNAATTQKPRIVLEALQQYYAQDNANIHRGIHALAERSTRNYEATRTRVCQFLNARSTEEIIFTSGTTAGINLVAHSYGRRFLQAGDQILISHLEHHSNIVPWQLLAEEKGLEINVIPVLDNGSLDQAAYAQLLNPKVKLVAVNQVSNALGTINPVAEMIAQAHLVGAKVLIDAAQSVAHLEVDVQALDADFLVFSSHKLFGPTGLGILYGKKEILEEMPPYQGGGEMIKEVSFDGTTFNELPYKFEAGTPNIADVVAFDKVFDFLEKYPKPAILAQELDLLHYATEQLQGIPGLRIVGQAPEKVGVISFVMEGLHHQDIGVLLDQMGIAIRTGHHCTQPLMSRFGLLGTCRASFTVYNTREEVNALVTALERVKRMLSA